jgi:hypothetical protein
VVQAQTLRFDSASHDIEFWSLGPERAITNATPTHVLNGWKDIARSLGKGVRTVQRWERGFGLPVRRLSGGRHHAIVAIPEELDAWLQSQSASSPSELETLHREVATLLEEIESVRRVEAVLRAENALLKRRFVAPTARKPSCSDLLDYALLTRSSQLLSQTSQLKEYTDQLHAESQALLLQHQNHLNGTRH